MTQPAPLKVPFHRAHIGEEEIGEVTSTLRSGWLTTGPKTKQFETEFAAYVGAKHAIALNSATAALHLALEAIGLRRGECVLVPTMTFAATAEVVRYFDAKPILVDCLEDDLNIDCNHARIQANAALARGEKLRAIIPVHYGGKVVDMAGIRLLAHDFNLHIIEDAAHCCPALYRDEETQAWRSVGDESSIACFSFYANKCITTGEGGMACTNNDKLAERMRIMSLHGISKDAWKRFTSEGSWYYEIIAPGYKYNLTDIASAIGLHQLRKADHFRAERERVAAEYRRRLLPIAELRLQNEDKNRVHAHHLFVVRLKLDLLKVDHVQVISALKLAGIGTSVHWMPLHMHPYYRETYRYNANDLPVAARIFPELISLPIFPTMTDEEIAFVCDTLAVIVAGHRR
ncbi:MAG: DegT/DnrJ/EryC1/StrS aminotransferase family protein [Phycisphaerae bacterium]